MTGAKSRPRIPFALPSRNNGPFSTTGANIMAFWACWESGASCFSITFCATRLPFSGLARSETCAKRREETG